MSYLRSRHNLQYIIIGLRFKVHPQRVCDIDHGSKPRTIREFDVQNYLFSTPLSPKEVLFMNRQGTGNNENQQRQLRRGVQIGFKNLVIIIGAIVIVFLLYQLMTA